MTEVKKLIVALERGDYATAFKISLPIAERGDAEAQANLGFMYREGLGVPRDDAEAAKWYLKAAEQGDAAYQYNLGHMYDYCLDATQGIAEVVKWYRKAAEQGHAEGPVRTRLHVRRWPGRPPRQYERDEVVPEGRRAG